MPESCKQSLDDCPPQKKQTLFPPLKFQKSQRKKPQQEICATIPKKQNTPMPNHPTRPRLPDRTILVYLPLCLISLAILWDWAIRLHAWGRGWDIHHFMYFGQRLVEGQLHWTSEFDDKLPVTQFLFWLPAYLDSFRVWLLMSMGASLLGAYAVYVLVADIFSATRGFPERPRHYTALYASVLVLYLFSSMSGDIHIINPLAVSASLVSLALCRTSYKQPERKLKMVLALVASCFCASLAIGLRPYLMIFVGIIPLWTSIAVQLEDSSRKVDCILAAKWFIAWNLGVLLFLLCVNVLPFVVVGELEAFLAGMALLSEDVIPQSISEILLSQLTTLAKMDMFTILLFGLWGILVFFLLRVLAGSPQLAGLTSKPVALDLFVLAILAPLSIQLLIYTKHIWDHYIQFFAPYASVGAASLVLLACSAKPEYLDFLRRHKVAVVFFFLILAGPFSPSSDLATRPKHGLTESKEIQAENLRRLLGEHGINDGDFLAPANMYVHWALGQHRHGFPHASHTDNIVEKNWWREADIPDKFNIPRNLDEYCRMLDTSGPKLIVFYDNPLYPDGNPLAECQLTRYDFHDVSGEAPEGRYPSAIRYYFLRKGVGARRLHSAKSSLTIAPFLPFFVYYSPIACRVRRH